MSLLNESINHKRKRHGHHDCNRLHHAGLLGPLRHRFNRLQSLGMEPEMSEKANWDGISRERKAKIAGAINIFGDCTHPMAKATNLDYFDMTYLLNCLMSGVELNQKLFEESQK